MGVDDPRQGVGVGLGAAPRCNQLQVFVRQNVVALQRTDVGRNPQQALAHRCRDKTT